MLNRVSDISPYMGCDPEFFFRFKGEIVGAEKVIPEKGLAYGSKGGYEDGPNGHRDGDYTSLAINGDSKFIIDGIQAELNPRPNTCRANLANEIVCCFRALKKELAKKGNEFTVDFSRAVEISKENLMALKDDSRKFGCAPSKNANKKESSVKGVKLNKVDPTEYRIRAAGGHIHIGKGGDGLTRALTTDHERTVKMLDIICGNTCVLVDRDPANVERRKLYGKAGEYRLPPHGLEYRTLSNFWLHSFPLMSLAFGLARLAVQLQADANHETYYKEFTSVVKPRNILKAIQKNDFDIAMENFKALEPLILQVSNNTDRYAIHKDNIKEFYYFVETNKKHGLSCWFPDDPMTHWTEKLGECHYGGFHDFLRDVVRPKIKFDNEAKIA